LGRATKELDDDSRFPFQRDRDRIIHTQAFRRLKGKTQVFVTGQGDHYRTRLTHTMEVAQIGRDIARTLSLNEDLAECIALAHDLGHPPFGHSGEEALNTWMRQYGREFEHNQQSHRIVSLLESRSSVYAGLNVNTEILEGLLKHRTAHDAPKITVARSPSLEAQAVNLADEIAYTGHDCDDGMHAELFLKEDILNVALVAEAYEHSAERGTSLRGALIHLLVSDLYKCSEKRLESVSDLSGVYGAKTPLIAFSQTMDDKLAELREFLWNRMYLHPDVRAKSIRGKEMVQALCTHLYAHPTAKVLSFQQNSNGALEEAVKDYVSGMTDHYATAQAEESGLL